MSAGANPREGIGGNSPPPLEQILAEKFADKLALVDAVAKLAEHAPKDIKSDDDLTNLGSIVKEARRHVKTLEENRIAEKEPFLDSGRVVDAFFSTQKERLSTIARILQGRADKYQDEQRLRRLAEQEAERKRLADEEREAWEKAEKARLADKAEEADEHETAAAALGERNSRLEQTSPAPIKQIVRAPSVGVTVSTKSTWRGEIIDFDKVDLDKLRPFLKRAEVQAALDRYVKQGHRTLDGARIYEEKNALFR